MDHDRGGRPVRCLWLKLYDREICIEGERGSWGGSRRGSGKGKKVFGELDRPLALLANDVGSLSAFARLDEDVGELGVDLVSRLNDRGELFLSGTYNTDREWGVLGGVLYRW